MVSRFNTALNTWTKPENIGMPFNSGGNDYMYAEDAQAGVGYFATDRFSDSAHVRVYTFVLPERRRYVRDAEGDELVGYARMTRYCHGERLAVSGERVSGSGDKNVAEVHDDARRNVASGTETAKVHTADAKWTGDSGLRSPHESADSRGPR